MALESGTFVADLNTANPSSTDPKSQGDDHLRLIKTVLQNTFAGFPGLVVITGVEAQGATANDYVVTLSPAPADYTAGFMVVFKATHANTGAASLALSALAAKPLKAADGTPLSAGDIKAGAMAVAWFDGSDFYLVSGGDRYATVTFVNQLAFQAALPDQSGNAGKFVTTDGTNASWADVPDPLPFSSNVALAQVQASALSF